MSWDLFELLTWIWMRATRNSMRIFILSFGFPRTLNPTVWYQNAEIIPNGKILGESQLNAHSTIFNKSQANSWDSHTEKVEFFYLICFVSISVSSDDVSIELISTMHEIVQWESSEFSHFPFNLFILVWKLRLSKSINSRHLSLK